MKLFSEKFFRHEMTDIDETTHALLFSKRHIYEEDFGKLVNTLVKYCRELKSNLNASNYTICHNIVRRIAPSRPDVKFVFGF